MEPVDREATRLEVDALTRELDEERFRHVAGLEPSPSLAALFAARSRAAHRGTAAALQDAGDEPLARAVAALRADRAAADHEESWRAADARASGRGPDGPIAVNAAAQQLLGERRRERRLALGNAVAEAFAGAAGPREGWAEVRARARAEVGSLPDWESVLEADELLNVSEDGYREVLQWLARRELEIAPRPHGDLARADLLHLLALPRWDGLFPAGMLAVCLRDALTALRLDLRRIRVDEAERPAQWAGAHAAGARVSFRRRGGAGDWLDLFEATGRALASTMGPPPHARDARFGVAIGALMAGLLLDRRFAERRLGVDRKVGADLRRGLALRQLFRLRAGAAALRVATEVERGTSGAAWHGAHRDALSLASLAAWPEGLAARDADAAEHAVRLRGWARAARLRRRLVEQFDEDWWRNPRAADALAATLAAGGAGLEEEPKLREPAEELVAAME